MSKINIKIALNEETLDEIQFIGAYKGYQFLIKRIPHFLYLSGYIEVDGIEIEDLEYIECYGGITWDGTINDKRHIGFDCAHFSDMTSSREDGTYRNLQFAINQCIKIINQLAFRIPKDQID